MGYGCEEESAGKFVFVNLYSARTGGYKPRTRQEQNNFLPHRGLEPSLLFAIPLLFQFIALQSFASSLFGFSARYSFVCVSALRSSCFPFLSAFLLSQSKKNHPCYLLFYVTALHFRISTFYLLSPHSYFRQNVTNKHSRL